MTVSSSVGRQLNVGKCIQRAMQVAGLLEASQSPKTADKELARDLLEAMIDGWQAYGVSARAQSFLEVTLTANDYTYDVASSVLGVYGDGMYISASESDTSKANAETVVRQASRSEWQTISAKSGTGSPRVYFLDRSADTLVLRYWPIPDEAGTVRHQVHRHLSDVDDDNATLDLKQYWHEPVIWGLAARMAFAKALPESRAAALTREADEKFRRARLMGQEHVDTYFHFSHNGT